MEYTARNYNLLAPIVYRDLLTKGVKVTSRNGDAIRLPGVTTMVVTNPWERVSFCAYRDANPFFHLIEAAAMLANVNDAPFLTHFSKNMANFTDDGQRYNAFYGERARGHFDQLEAVRRELHEKPNSRQAVVALWDKADLIRSTKDKACNLMMLFSVNPQTEALEMTTFNRSNDAIWGILTGANIVHLSFFQEWMALSLNRGMGPWTHVTNNLHVYTSNPKWPGIADVEACDAYGSPELIPPTFTHGMVDASNYTIGGANTKAAMAVAHMRQAIDRMQWCIKNHQWDLSKYVSEHDKVECPWVYEVLVPMFEVWQLRKLDAEYGLIQNRLAKIESPDWRLAARNWIERRFRR